MRNIIPQSLRQSRLRQLNYITQIVKKVNYGQYFVVIKLFILRKNIKLGIEITYRLQQTITDEAVIDMKGDIDLDSDDESENDATTDELVEVVNYVNTKTSSRD